MKRSLRKRKKKAENLLSTFGKIIDMSLVDFERELIEQKVNIGTINNLILNLESVYFELRMRKDAILKATFECTIPQEESNKAVNGLYAEMIKVEQKITYLKQRREELIEVDNH